MTMVVVILTVVTEPQIQVKFVTMDDIMDDMDDIVMQLVQDIQTIVEMGFLILIMKLVTMGN